jgi:hypothetical protein
MHVYASLEGFGVRVIPQVPFRITREQGAPGCIGVGCQQEYRLLIAGQGAPVFLVVPRPAQQPPEKHDTPRKRQVPPQVRAALEVLGIAESASLAELRRAYLDLVASYHPDKVASLGLDLRKVAEEKTKQINEAYAVARAFAEDAAQ